jgi:hypothetical protein
VNAAFYRGKITNGEGIRRRKMMLRFSGDRGSQKSGYPGFIQKQTGNNLFVKNLSGG